MNKSKPKTCLVCNEKILGRSDKRFCSSDCRTAYHNTRNRNATLFMSGINSILRKNRRILAELNSSGRAKVQKEQLVEEGFKFAYHTNEFVTKSGKIYKFCYEQGYLELEPGLFALVVKHDYVV
ncbi:MAG TPA: hypothetical protein PKA12_11245 [Saprospiraceae bacterium]|nr:hypothetical protein [Saprospiraceae bacterium]